ncbi:MAG: HlyD family efflux transporter periplasmic adaptor subunit [Ginsengibacter sp.]
MRNYFLLLFAVVFSLDACHPKKEKFDATGSFEADEVIVSSEINGQLLSFNVHEGDSLKQNQVVGTVDAENIVLQKEQVEANIQSLSEKTSNVNPQVALLKDQLKVQQAQLNNMVHEKGRIERLVKADAATGKQLDDITNQVDVAGKQILVTQQQISVQRSNVATQNRSILSEAKPLQKRAEQLQQQLSKSKITNPLNGIVITTYAENGEVTSQGKALYKIADLSVLTLRAYITGVQLSQVKLNQQVTVLIDDGADKYKTYPGVISWISDKAEFTPKTIQTKEERVNLVYAVKIKVKNDGFLKIGMYGEVKLQQEGSDN